MLATAASKCGRSRDAFHSSAGGSDDDVRWSVKYSADGSVQQSERCNRHRHRHRHHRHCHCHGRSCRRTSPPQHPRDELAATGTTVRLHTLSGKWAARAAVWRPSRISSADIVRRHCASRKWLVLQDLFSFHRWSRTSDARSVCSMREVRRTLRLLLECQLCDNAVIAVGHVRPVRSNSQREDRLTHRSCRRPCVRCDVRLLAVCDR